MAITFEEVTQSVLNLVRIVEDLKKENEVLRQKLQNQNTKEDH